MNQWALEIRRKMETLFLADCIGIFRRYLRLLGEGPRFRSLREGISKATLSAGGVRCSSASNAYIGLGLTYQSMSAGLGDRNGGGWSRALDR